jgi:hypothetical protein
MFESLIETLSQLLRRPAIRCDVRLKGVAGFTGVGDVRFTAWRDGHVRLDADLRGVAGLKAELWARGAKVGPLAGDNGRISAHFDTKNGGPSIALAAGDLVEVRQNGAVILAGVLSGSAASARRAGGSLRR